MATSVISPGNCLVISTRKFQAYSSFNSRRQVFDNLRNIFFIENKEWNKYIIKLCNLKEPWKVFNFEHFPTEEIAVYIHTV